MYLLALCTALQTHTHANTQTQKTPFIECHSYQKLSFGPVSTDGAQPELFIFNELCALKDEPGPCKANKERFFFNVDTGNCQLFQYGGCGGNANNFQTLEACEETCVVSGESTSFIKVFELFPMIHPCTC